MSASSGRRDDNGASWSSGAERWLWLAVAVVTAAALVPTLTPAIVGLFHDDAIYASGAKVLAETGSYRLHNLPNEPFQTKYPPFYPALLALVWRLQPGFPGNVFVLKALNLIFVAVATVGIAALARRQHPSASWMVPVACQLVLVTNPMVVGFSDYLMTDVLFMAMTVLILLRWGSGPSTMSLGRDGAVVMLAAVAILSRSVGIAFSGAIVVDCLLRGQRSRAALHGAAALIVLLAWMGWASLYRPDSSPLIDYYVQYERPAFSYLLTEPGTAVRIVTGNIRLIGDSMFVALGLSWFVTWPILLLLIVPGLIHMAKSGWRMPLLFAGGYLALVVAHPFAPFRYLLPLVPLCILAIVSGVQRVWTLVQSRQPSSRHPVGLATVAVLTSIVLGNAVSLPLHFRPSENLRWWNGADMRYRWAGFEETFEWVRRNTPEDARLGAFFDPMYFLYTNRRAVRPWFHHSETYFYPYGAAKPFVGDPDRVAGELRRLDVGYVVIDPPVGYAEGKAAVRLLRAVVALPHVNADLVFTSHDGLHEVYRLWNDAERPRFAALRP